jgi:O-antigen ligase
VNRAPIVDSSGFWPALLLTLALVLLPVGRSAEAAIAAGAIAGLALAWRHRGALRADRAMRLVAFLFACYWLPALLSAPGSVAPQKSWETVGTLLRFLPFAAFACLALRASRVWPRLLAAIAMLVVLWLLDAWVQAFTGFSIAGPMSSERLTGVFGAANLKLGPVLAVLSPFVFSAALARFGRLGLAAAFVLQLVPILLAGSRAGWLMYALVTLTFVWRQARSGWRFAAWSGVAAALIALAGMIAWHASPAFDTRVARSLLVLGGSQQAVDEASAGRLRIWSTALRMSAAHPLAGVGVRAFRHAYPAYAQPGDAFVDTATDEGASHAHQIVLEVLSETGIVGLAFWIAGAVAAIRAWRRAGAAARARALAPALALAAMCFPLDTHLAFYSAWWGLLFWWLLALYCAALAEDPIAEDRIAQGWIAAEKPDAP